MVHGDASEDVSRCEPLHEDEQGDDDDDENAGRDGFPSTLLASAQMGGGADELASDIFRVEFLLGQEAEFALGVLFYFLYLLLTRVVVEIVVLEATRLVNSE